MAELKRQLGLLDSTMINVGTIIASAIFIVPSAIAATLGATGPAILVWVVGVALPGGGAGNLAPLWADAPPGHQIASFGVALVAVLWAYDGWIEITYVGSEVTDPERNLPRSIVLSTIIGMALYCLVTASFAYVLSPAKMAASSLVASDAAQVTLGGAGAALVAVAIMIATIGSNNGIVLTAARIPYAMARDGLLPRRLAGVHPRALTPAPSLVVQGIVAIALTWISTEPSWKGTYNRLFTYVVLGEFIFYGMSAGAVILLRYTAAALPRPYRTWGYPVTPLVFVLFSVWLIWNTAYAQLLDFAVGMALILAGLPWYWWRKASSVIRHPSSVNGSDG